MYLVKLIKETIKFRKRAFIAITINTLVILLFYQLLFENSEFVYPLILSFSVIVVYFFIELLEYIKLNKSLEDVKNSPDYKYKGNNLTEEKIIEMIKGIHIKYLKEIHELNEKYEEREKIFSKWIHNMKTSVAVIELITEKEGITKEELKDIKIENNNLKNNLEQCLNIIRLEEFARDYVTEEYSLNKIVVDTINKKKRDFIYGKVFPKFDETENINVYTDKKWLMYIIEQILSNGIKYSQEGSLINIKIEKRDEKAILIIKDNGIGIHKKDINRVFDAFYTGKNGRKYISSSGIGLYMAREVAKKLNHKIKLTSELNRGTKVEIII